MAENRENVGEMEIGAGINFTDLNKDVKELQLMLDKLDPVMKKAQKGLDGIEKKGKVAAGSINALEKEAKQLRDKLERLAPGTKAFIQTAQKLKGVEKKLAGVRKEADKLTKQTKLVSSSLTKLTGAFAAGQVAATTFQRALRQLGDVAKFFGTEPIKQAVSFEATLAKLSTLIEGDARVAIQGLSKDVREMAVRFGKDANDVGIGLFNIMQAGIEDTGEAMMLLEGASKAAVAGVTDVSTSAKVLTQITNAYNQSAEDTIDQLDAIFIGAQKGSAEFVDLAGSLGVVLNSAAQLDVGIDEVVAAVETMVNAGISADEATTALNRMFLSIIKAGKGSGESAELAKELSIQYNSAALRAKGLQGFVEDLTEAVGEDEEAMLQLTGDVRAFRAASTIAGKGADQFTEMLEAMRKEGNALAETFEKMANTVEFKAAQAWSEFNDIIREAGQDFLPELHSALKDIREILNENRNEIKEAAQALSGVLVEGIQSVIENAPELIENLSSIMQLLAGIANMAIAAAKGIKFITHDLGSKHLKSGLDFLIGEEGVGKSIGRSASRQFFPKQEPFPFTPVDQDTQFMTPVRPEDLMTHQRDVGKKTKDEEEKKKKKKKTKQERDQEKKELEEFMKLETQNQRDKLFFMSLEVEMQKDQLDVKHATGELTEKEGRQLKVLERTLKRIDGLSGDAFDIRQAEDFTDAMGAMNKVTQSIGKEYQNITNAITKTEKALDDLIDSSKKRVQDLRLEIADIDQELEKLFGKDGSVGSQQKERVKRLAEAFVEAEGKLKEGDATEADKKTIEEINDILFPHAGASDAAKQFGEDMRNVLSEAIKELREQQDETIVERIQREQDAEDELLKQKLENKKKEHELQIELEEAFQEDKLEKFLEEHEEELSEKQKAFAQDILQQRQHLESQLAEERRVQNEIVVLFEASVNIKDGLSEAFNQREISRLQALQAQAIATIQALAAARRAALGSTQGFAAGGPVPGAGSGDIVPAMLEPGEHVLTKREVQAAGGHGHILALRKMLLSGLNLDVQRYAEGGAVENSVDNSKTFNLKQVFNGSKAQRMQKPSLLQFHAKRAF